MDKLRNLSALLRLHLFEYIRDPLAAGFSFALPLFFLFSFGLTTSVSQSRISSLAIAGAQGAKRSADEVRNVLQVDPQLKTHEAPFADALQELKSKKVDAVVVVDDPVHLVVRSEGKSFGDWVSQKLELGFYRTEAGAYARPRITVETLNGGSRNQFDFIAPGLFALALLQLGLFGTGNQIIQARHSGMLRRLRCTPLTGAEIIGSHVLVRLAVAALQMLLLGLVAHAFFGFSVQNGLWRMVMASTTAALTLTLLGYVVGGIAPTMQSGAMILTMANFFMMFCGQVFFDLRGSTLGAVVTYLHPVSFAADSFRYVINGSQGSLPFWGNQLVVCAWGAGLFLIATRYFKYGMDKE